MINVLHVFFLSKMKTTGSGNYLLNLEKHLKKQGVQSFTIAGNESMYANYRVKEKEGKRMRIDYPKDLASLTQVLHGYTRDMEYIIEKHNINLLNIHHIGYPMFVGALCKYKYNIHMLTTSHGTGYMEILDAQQNHPNLYNVANIFQEMTKHSDGIVACSQDQKKLISQTFPNQKKNIHVISPGVDEFYFTPPEGGEKLPYKDFYFLPARITPQKGITDAMYAFQDNHHANLIIAGKQQDLDISYIKKYKNITYIGEVDTTKMKALYYKAKATIIPSKGREPFGLVAVESMACGTPFITYGKGGLGEILNEKVGVKIKDKQELKDVITKGLPHFEKEEIIKEAKKYSRKNTAISYKDLYTKILNKKK